MNEKKGDKEEKEEEKVKRDKYKKKQNVYENSMSSNCFLFHIYRLLIIQ